MGGFHGGHSGRGRGFHGGFRLGRSSGDIYGDNIGGFEYQGDRSHETNYGSKSSKDDDSNFRLKL